MIEFIDGLLTAKSPSQVVVQIGGMGLRGMISLTTYDALPAVGEPARLWTWLHVRDDELALFAFASQEERWMFQHLISVSGIGPRLAMILLSAARPETLRKAIAENDSDRLKSIPRIGSKIAERIVLELKSKVGEAAPEFGEAATKGGEIRAAISALSALGFTRAEAEKAVDTAVKRGGKGTEELVKMSLRTA